MSSSLHVETGYLYRVFMVFLRPSNQMDNTSVRWPPLPSTSFPIHLSTSHPTSRFMQSEVLTGRYPIPACLIAFYVTSELRPSEVRPCVVVLLPFVLGPLGCFPSQFIWKYGFYTVGVTPLTGVQPYSKAATYTGQQKHKKREQTSMSCVTSEPTIPKTGRRNFVP
jgi:hypothetical protein